MKPRLHGNILMYAAIPFLLMTGSQEAGIITHVSPDGSGERLVYARTAADRVPETQKYIQTTLPVAAIERVKDESGQKLVWRDTQAANLANVAEAEFGVMNVIQKPFSFFTTYSWKEKVSFDPGSVTDAEKVGLDKVKLDYIVQMPGKVTNVTPAGETTGNQAEFKLDVSEDPVEVTVEAQSLRWPWILVWAWIIGYIVYRITHIAPKMASRVPKQPRRI